MFVVGPATEYFIAGSWHSSPPHSFAAEWVRHFADGEILSDSGPLWFCLVLLGFSLCFAGYHRLLPALPTDRIGRMPSVAAVLGYAAAMTTVTFSVGVIAPRGGTILNVDVHDFPQYPLMFAAGVMAWRHDWPRYIPHQTGGEWLVGGLIVSGLLWLLLITQGGALDGDLSAYGGGWHWQAAGMAIWRSFTCLSLSLGLVTLYRDHFDGQGPVTGFLTRSAFGVYVFHAPILIAITRVLHDWPADVAVKFFTASMVGIAATFLFVGLIARRTPGLRAIV